MSALSIIEVLRPGQSGKKVDESWQSRIVAGAILTFTLRK